jgi:hypothetical protein
VVGVDCVSGSNTTVKIALIPQTILHGFLRTGTATVGGTGPAVIA